ncbi:hypothetical protein BGW36DRAFT_360987 [Talaromyces proteolyticus]|uniref:SnoaL-like domain-containing protein n=1 Tax=Talaromyces proteolyticus TaxID=1131652 RepID=A0AAD4KL67_9EURO|nr:uncharacterized protein BGW36DRAFT_360987 [Talaromyces proteolyticus]KAH8695283.1 hypothetical protein BGW36DRAFT_360987 [Talaromyces proteolyticus]
MTSTTEWPSTEVPQPVKDLIAKFMEVGDTKSDEAGHQLGYEVFVPNGKIKVNKRVIDGAEAIAATHRDQMASIKGRRHQVHKVYTCNEATDDLILIGSVERYLHDGRTLETDFAARLVIENASSENPQLSLFNAWSLQNANPSTSVRISQNSLQY